MVHPQQVEEFTAGLPEWGDRIAATPPPPGLHAEAELAELDAVLGNLRRRLREGPDAPLRVAFFGPTGVGKSKLFSSLVGAPVSPSGFRRPFTRRPVYFVHRDWRSVAPTLVGDVQFHEDASWRRLILIDAPDFDSVELRNREEAERIFRETDAFLFLTDSLKYADASTWAYLARIARSGKPCCVLLNKAGARDVVEDFETRLEELSGAEILGGEVHVFPELPIDDDTLVPPDHPRLASLRGTLIGLGTVAGGGGIATTLFGRELEQCFSTAADLLRALRAYRDTLEDARGRLAERCDEAGDRIRSELTTELAPEVRGEISRRVLQRLEAVDVLRYPRRLLALPLEGVKALWRRWRPGGEGDAPADDDATASAATSESFLRLESALIRFAEDTRDDFRDHPPLGDLLTRPVYRELRMSRDEALAVYEERLDRFREWVAWKAQESASELTSGSRLKFILSQVIFNSVLIGAQVHTGGVLTLFELGMDGVVSPLVAKAIGLALSSEKVREFESRAHEEHHRLVLEILAESRERFAGFLDRAGEGFDRLEEDLVAIDRYRASADAIRSWFAERRAPSETIPCSAEDESGENG